MFAYKDLLLLAKSATAFNHVFDKDDTIFNNQYLQIIVQLAVDKVYEVFSLSLREGVINVPNVAEYIELDVPEDCIFINRFFDENGVTIKHNSNNSYIRYTGNMKIEIDYEDAPILETIYYTYRATYDGHDDMERFPFTEQYLEPFMTYVNYILNRTVAFTGEPYLEVFKKDYLESINDVKSKDLNYRPNADHNVFFRDNGFV